ncbi:MAG: phytase [Chlamydiia bacterium]|nr:phytase [Chlamydiia bacterium]
MDRKKTSLIPFWILLLSLFFVGCADFRHRATREGARSRAKTRSLPGKADEVAIWADRDNPINSVLICNDKAPMGALYVFDMSGKQVSRSERLNRPVGVSVRYDVNLGGEVIDVVACGIRSTNEMKIFKMDKETRKLIDITTLGGISSGFPDRTYGICLYKRLSDGQLFAFLSRKETDNIHQIMLEDDGTGKFKGTIVRKFGKKDQKSFVEGMVADDEWGYFYCSDERHAILKYFADPSVGKDPFIQMFGVQDNIRGDREGLSIYRKPNRKGYIVVSSQGDSTFKVYNREGKNKFIKSFALHDVWRSDGIASTALPIPPHYPTGVFAAHNDGDNNYAIFDWFTCTGLK